MTPVAPQTAAAAADLAAIQALEERAFNAWPAPATIVHDGWLFRLAGGYTKRANSVNAAAPGLCFDGVRDAAEAFYRRHGLPAVFRLSPLAPAAADAALAQAGYVEFDPTQVARASLAVAAADPAVRIDAVASAAWFDGITAALGVTPAQDALHRAIVRSIALPAACATLQADGEPVGHGLAVLDRAAVGLYDIAIRPDRRGRGHGATLTRALMQWGRERGAVAAYLQVREQNGAARRLYARLGFEDQYRYHYRVPDGSPRAAGAG